MSYLCCHLGLPAKTAPTLKENRLFQLHLGTSKPGLIGEISPDGLRKLKVLGKASNLGGGGEHLAVCKMVAIFQPGLNPDVKSSGIFAAEISEDGDGTMLDFKEVKWQTVIGLSIETMIFDLG